MFLLIFGLDRKTRKARKTQKARIIQIIQIARIIRKNRNIRITRKDRKDREGPVEDKINVFFPHSKIIILSFLKYIDITMIMMIACG